ncbi:MAG TPA: endopeptidase La [Noviherbaspirillum sp.]|uniref:endopeptidase La n=1 Tax=Noviherbaspirillum sp. TaxID=1926288 RepID=UPI002B4747EB|nr:endopeptidase La [Noviherbaspirillum sp.]HJV86140.1 endopeptidase La [Noviherbaspirillum sp.]
MTAGDAPDLPADAIVIIPLRSLVLFPGMIAPINLGRERSIAAAREAVRLSLPVGLVLQHDAEEETPTPEQLYRTGTMASVLRFISGQDGANYLVCQGEQRFRVIEFLEGYPFHAARIQQLKDPEEQSADIQARMIQVKERAAEIIDLLPQAPSELTGAAENIESASALADFVAGLMDLPLQQKQDLLETRDLQQRLDKVLRLLVRRIEVLRLSHEIHEQTRERIDDRQREYLLREQLKTIQDELGEPEGIAGELQELGEAIARACMPEDVEGHARKELQRLQRMPEASAEYGMLSTWLEWMSELPWATQSEDRIDIAEARRILDEDHFGLQKVKRRILEHLAVRKLNPHGKSPILCFVGPPGVGKTSLGQSIARATGRSFARVSLGGVYDEAEIRGHRRTYVGAMPGNIIQAIRKAASRNCVLMLDEIDKLGAGVHGDPASALLEVLDPEQNANFRDHYLGQPFDLSKVFFISTANMLDSVPIPLLDRMEVIRLPGYTEEEKMQIARRYLVRRQLEAAGLDAQQCVLHEETLHALIRDYTREAGVRNLEREIGNVMRYVAVRVAEGSAQQMQIGLADLPDILGPRKFESELAMRTSLPGVATGLAWTPVGGDILFIEASRTPGSGKLILTGQLGDIMKESAQAALTLVKARCDELQVAADVFDKNDIHVHVPAGAMPKDGPSAGVAIYVALASLVRDKPVRNDCAMTGEISLRGLVLPVGGVKEKVLAALQAGIRTVMLPARNRKELDEIPEEARRQLHFVWLDTVDEAMREAIGNLIIGDIA